MFDQNLKVLYYLSVIGFLSVITSVRNSSTQRMRVKAIATIEGDTWYQVLPSNAIPAIMEPVFLSGNAASAQMSDEEPILGLLINKEARAYSLWQLDAHELVNDKFGDVSIAVTW